MQPLRCQSLLKLPMEAAVKCQITLFFPLSHFLREHKPKPELVLQQFSYNYHVQQPVTRTRRRAAWLLTYFLTFCQSLMNT